MDLSNAHTPRMCTACPRRAVSEEAPCAAATLEFAANGDRGKEEEEVNPDYYM